MLLVKLLARLSLGDVGETSQAQEYTFNTSGSFPTIQKQAILHVVTNQSYKPNWFFFFPQQKKKVVCWLLRL